MTNSRTGRNGTEIRNLDSPRSTGGVLGVQTPTASCFIILYNIYPSINGHPLSEKSLLGHPLPLKHGAGKCVIMEEVGAFRCGNMMRGPEGRITFERRNGARNHRCQGGF